MPRTTSDDVAGVIEVDDTISLTPFILTANELVTECCADAEYSDTRLELIERWLAAHFYAVRDMRRASEGVGPVQESVQYRLGLILQSTMYGQQAMMLDTAGGLARLSKEIETGRRRTTVGATWLGTDLT